MHMSKTTALCAALALGGFASAASATSFTFDYASNDGTEGAFGMLTATANGDGTFTATGGSVTAFGPDAAGSGALIPNPGAPAPSNSPLGVFGYDDQLLPGQNPLITFYGLLFNIGGTEMNIFSNGPGPGTYELALWTGNGYNTVLGNFTLSEVPEPASWAVMLLGFGLIGTALRSRKPVTA